MGPPAIGRICEALGARRHHNEAAVARVREGFPKEQVWSWGQGNTPLPGRGRWTG